MRAVFIASYIAVLGAEIAGDKLLYALGLLAGRFSRVSIASGMAAAFMLKMGAAVTIGSAITHLPRAVVLISTGASFLWIAWSVWRHQKAEFPTARRPSSAAVMLSFSAVAFSEWADLGQITAAAMAARFNAPFIVWIGAVLAMMTKGVLAITVGGRLQRWTHGRMSDATIRYASVALLLTLGTLSILETLGK
jgi:putative Ca2+/H+ antiporter (TMEM165/GDT1 family)